MDHSTLKAIANPGLLVKARDGFLCNSGRTVFSIKKVHYSNGELWVVLTPDGRLLRHFEMITSAVLYIIGDTADVESFAPQAPATAPDGSDSEE